jgi:hypothetical protein
MRQDVLGSRRLLEPEPEAVIREARRRQRRRQLVIGLAVGVVLAGAAGMVAGVGLSPRLIAYGTGCQDRDTAANDYYTTCPVLRVFDVLTAGLLSFPAPPGTAGWMPPGFDFTRAIAPRDPVIAAYAATRPLGHGQDRLYVIRLPGATRRPMAVPSSAARLNPRTAWSATRAAATLWLTTLCDQLLS